MIGCHCATDWAQHEVTSQQEKEIAESQQKTRPLTVADIDQVKEVLFLHDGDRLSGTQSFISADNDRVAIR